MKILKYLLVVVVLVIISCDSDDDNAAAPTNPLLVATSINFVKANGNDLDTFTCAKFSDSYAVRVDARFEGDERPVATRLDFTVNGDIYSVTFSSNGSKLIPVNLIPGNNTAQISGSNIFSSTLFTVDQGDFVEVP